MRYLNLYSGIGGNRSKLPDDVEVTAVEYDQKVADVYSRLWPNDEIIVTDAHSYLLDNYQRYDFIWSSPVCVTRSKFTRSGRNRKPYYVDMSVYQQYLLLNHMSDAYWVIENVHPFFNELIPPTIELGRHRFWTNFHVEPFVPPELPGMFEKTREELHDFHEIYYSESLCNGTNHDPSQPLRNAVHGETGLHLYNCALGTATYNQDDLFTMEQP